MKAEYRLPLHARIEAGGAYSTIGKLASYLHLPNNLRRSGLGDLEDGGMDRSRRRGRGARGKFDVAVVELASRTPEIRKDGASLSSQVISAVLAFSSRWMTGTRLSHGAAPEAPQSTSGWIVGPADCRYQIAAHRECRRWWC